MIAVGRLPAVARADARFPSACIPRCHVRSRTGMRPSVVAALGRGRRRLRPDRADVCDPPPDPCPLLLKALAAGNGRSLCLVVGRWVRDQRLCLAELLYGLVETHRGADAGTLRPTRWLRTGGARQPTRCRRHFPPAAARLTHGRVVWHMSSEWADDARPVRHGCWRSGGVHQPRCRNVADPKCGCTGVRGRVRSGGRIAAQAWPAPTAPGGADVRRRIRGADRSPFCHTEARAHPRDVLRTRREVRLYPALVGRTLAEGHSIGNHTWDHRPMTSLSIPPPPTASCRARRPSFAGHPASRRACSALPAAPSTQRSPPPPVTGRCSASCGTSIRGTGRRRAPTRSCLANVLGHAHAGSIILLHDAGGPRGETVAALPRIIAGLRARNLAFVTARHG